MGPLSDEEKADLIVDHVIDRSSIYALEQINIEKAVKWTFGKRLNDQRVINEAFIKSLHQKMYGDVWKWAGRYRTSERNLGIAHYKIAQELKVLVDDTLFWVKNDIYNAEEIAIRFKHRIVSIHCFPNGNGRHSRLMADLIIEKIYKQKYFSWGGSTLIKDDEKRRKYISALKKADIGEYHDLILFARS